MIGYYRYILAVHLIAIISWMAGILYLYRILIYASEKGTENAEVHQLLSTMASRLYRYITLPAMITSWILGLSLIAISPELIKGGWFHVKIIAVLILTGFTVYANVLAKHYIAKSKRLPHSRRLRFLNEVPTILMIIIVFMVILKPF